jgi:hypothetical protein
MARPALEFSFPRLVVIFVLLSSRPRNLLSYLVFFTPTKRYQEVDGVRKEKERLTTDPKDDSFKEPVKRPLG